MAPERFLVPHARGCWLDPTTGVAPNARTLLGVMARRRVVLLGETHDVAEIHRWQLQVATCLHLLRPGMAMGFEMFPRAVQPVLDRWVAGQLTTQAFLEEVEWERHWGFHPNLYLPLFHFCRQQGVPMLALNCHRPLVTRVGRDGWGVVPEAERDGLTPSAPATDAYRRHLAVLTGRSEVPDRFVRAQQTWDRAFACNIVRALRDGCPLVVGIIGRGHLEYGFGTPFQLRDLGVEDAAVLLPEVGATQDLSRVRGIATALFRLDTPEPPSSWRPTRAVLPYQ